MYNCLGITLFFNEPELLFLQIKTLSRVCDHIIIVEPECNTRGIPRENLEFGNFLERFGDMIKGIPYEYLLIPKKEFKEVKDLSKHLAGEDNVGRCRSIPIINNKANYYIYNDVDEVFSDEQTEEIRSLISDNFKGNRGVKFWHHNHYLNWRCFYRRGWKRNLCLMRSNPVINREVHLFDYESGQEFALKFKGKIQRPTQTDILKNTGYHFSFLYSLETKLKSYSHTELTNQASSAAKRREQKLAAVQDWKCKSLPMESIQIQALHENIEIFKPFIAP